MDKAAVVRSVVTCKDKMLVTERNYEKRTHVIKNHWECKLSCGHWEYRTFSTMHREPTTLACAACTGRVLSRKEIVRTDAEATPVGASSEEASHG